MLRPYLNVLKKDTASSKYIFELMFQKVKEQAMVKNLSFKYPLQKLHAPTTKLRTEKKVLLRWVSLIWYGRVLPFQTKCVKRK